MDSSMHGHRARDNVTTPTSCVFVRNDAHAWWNASCGTTRKCMPNTMRRVTDRDEMPAKMTEVALPAAKNATALPNLAPPSTHTPAQSVCGVSGERTLHPRTLVQESYTRSSAAVARYVAPALADSTVPSLCAPQVGCQR